MKRIYILLIFFPLICGAQPLPTSADVVLPPALDLPKPLTNSVQLQWEFTLNTNAHYKVWCRSESVVYTTNWACNTTNILLPCTWLYPGTNFLSVTAEWTDTDGQSAVVSDHSKEVRVIRLQTFPIWIKTDVQSKANIEGEWGEEKKFYLFAVREPKPSEFYRARIGIEIVEQDSLHVEF